MVLEEIVLAKGEQMNRTFRGAALVAIVLGSAPLAFSEVDPGKLTPSASSIHEGQGTVYSKTPDDLWTATIEDDKLYLVDRRTKQKVGDPIPTVFAPQRWSFSPDGRYLAIGEGYKRREQNHGCIEVWDVVQKKMVVKENPGVDGKRIGSVTHVGFGKHNSDIRFTAERVRYDGK